MLKIGKWSFFNQSAAAPQHFYPIQAKRPLEGGGRKREKRKNEQKQTREREPASGGQWTASKKTATSGDVDVHFQCFWRERTTLSGSQKPFLSFSSSLVFLSQKKKKKKTKQKKTKEKRQRKQRKMKTVRNKMKCYISLCHFLLIVRNGSW